MRPQRQTPHRRHGVSATNLIGFDSAWADNPRQPGAICALRIENDTCVFHAPELVGFDAARTFVEKLHRPGNMTLVAIDQPTIVPNLSGARPAERVAASVMSWSGGGIQPAFRGKASMFGDDAPIWRFIDTFHFDHDAEAAVSAESGLFVMEVYPALALLGLDPAFVAVGKSGPRYNPSRPTFKQAAWRAVLGAAAGEATRLGLPDVAAWCGALDPETKPRKGTQDELDAVLCLLIAMRWRRERASCVMIGDLEAGYIVALVEDVVRMRLRLAADLRGVSIS